MKGKGRVVSVSMDGGHRFSKGTVVSIELMAGIGVAGDAHAGETVKHRSRVVVDPTQPNLRQVHLLHAELFEELSAQGFQIAPGDIGENITTRGVALLELPRGSQIVFASGAVVEITGLRNPCGQLDRFRPGLMNAVLERKGDGTLVRKAGVMGVVLRDGRVSVGDAFEVRLPPQPHEALQCV